MGTELLVSQLATMAALVAQQLRAVVWWISSTSSQTTSNRQTGAVSPEGARFRSARTDPTGPATAFRNAYSSFEPRPPLFTPGATVPSAVVVDGVPVTPKVEP